MREKKLTQARLAQIMEVTQPTISFWLNEGFPNPAMRVLLAQRLDVTFKWLIYGEGSKEGALTKHLKIIEKIRAKYVPLMELYADLIREGDERVALYRARIREIRDAFASEARALQNTKRSGTLQRSRKS
jgi:transcriptional regulator with XRE-family HTH domain